jgi:serine/threonine protein kinase
VHIAGQLLKVLCYLHSKKVQEHACRVPCCLLSHSFQVIHRAIEPKNVVWKEREGQPVIQLISLGHAKLEKTIEDEELAFIEGAKSGHALLHTSAGAVPTFQPLSDRQANPFLASEYKHDVVHQPHYAMDWFAGLNQPKQISGSFFALVSRCRTLLLMNAKSMPAQARHASLLFTDLFLLQPVCSCIASRNPLLNTSSKSWPRKSFAPCFRFHVSVAISRVLSLFVAAMTKQTARKVSPASWMMSRRKNWRACSRKRF